MVKQTQFAYEEEWADRKNKTGKTWREIMELGIIAAEAELGVKYVGGEQKKANSSGETTTEKTTKPASTKKKAPVEVAQDDTPPDGPFEIVVSPPKGVEERDFDVYEDEMWQTVNAFSDIMEGEIFRIRDDGKVVEFNGVKCFSYEELPYKNERKQKCAKVVARAIV